MAPDSQVQALLDAMASAPRPPMQEQTPAQLREMLRGQTQMTGPGPDVARVADLAIPSPAGDIPARAYWPEGEGPFPIFVWFHGGGWVIGDVETADPTCRSLAVGARALVVNVDYRRAPEHQHPAALEDAIAAVAWVAANAGELGGDATRLGVGGDSAGGNLATLTAIEARRSGGPDLRFQLLVYPVTDGSRSLPSYTENAVGYGLTAAAMAWFYDLYVGGGDATDPSVSPLHAPAHDLVGLPPALVITAELDVLRDEGEAYARRLEDAGVPVTVSRYDGQIHGFFGMPTVLDGGKAAVEEASEALRQALG